MVTELDEAQSAVAGMLSDPAAYHAWLADPHGYARDRLARFPRAAEMLAGLGARGIWTSATFAVDKVGFAPPGPDREVLADDVAPARSAHLWADRPLVGVGYRPELIPHLWRHLRDIEVYEHTVDRYLEGWPHGREELARFASLGPVTLHSVHLSVGSRRCRDDLDRVDAIGALCKAARVDNLSDHLAWTRTGSYQIGDFVPLWRTEAQLDLVCENVAWLQDRLGVRLAFENASVFFDPGGDMTWAEFANELVRRTGCGLLLDVTNLLLNERNGIMLASDFTDELDLDAVLAVHLAGGHIDEDAHIDSHEHPVLRSDLELLSDLLPRLHNCRSVIIERDGRYEEGAELVDDLAGLRSAVDAALAADTGAQR